MNPRSKGVKKVGLTVLCPIPRVIEHGVDEGALAVAMEEVCRLLPGLKTCYVRKVALAIVRMLERAQTPVCVTPRLFPMGQDPNASLAKMFVSLGLAASEQEACKDFRLGKVDWSGLAVRVVLVKLGSPQDHLVFKWAA